MPTAILLSVGIIAWFAGFACGALIERELRETVDGHGGDSRALPANNTDNAPPVS